MVYPVGFKVVYATDSTRPLPTTHAARPVQISVWYPAIASPGHDRLAFRDYLGLSASELAPNGSDTGAAGHVVEDYKAFLKSRGAADVAIDAWLDRQGEAVRNASPSPGRFPLVLLAPGNGNSASDQAWLGEYLARRGYVVATSPSPTRITGPMEHEEEMGARAAEQAADLALVLATLARLPQVEVTRVGVVGHSFGARAALLFAMAEPRVRALVSLDGGIGTATGRASLEAEPGFHARASKAPILHFYETLDPFMAPDFALLRTLTSADEWLVGPVGLHHHLFTSLGADTGLGAATGATAGSVEAYSAVTLATGRFLDAFLKGNGRVLQASLPSDWARGLPVTRVRASTKP